MLETKIKKNMKDVETNLKLVDWFKYDINLLQYRIVCKPNLTCLTKKDKITSQSKEQHLKNEHEAINL